MFKHNIPDCRNLFMFTLALVLNVVPLPSSATIKNVHGFEYSKGEILCSATQSSLGRRPELKANACDIPVTQKVYVPHSGQYKVEAWLSDGESASSHAVYIDENVSLDSIDIDMGGAGSVSLDDPGYNVTFCYKLIDEAGNEFFIDDPHHWCSSGTPLPPTPPVPPTSCNINSGNALNVNLGTVERSQLPTEPATGSAKHIPVDVTCTGGVDVTVTMQLDYTPISITNTEIAKSSSNGLGVAIIYNGKSIRSTDMLPVTFVTGPNTLDLAFQAIRDPKITVAEIPTGAFTASAVLVMTQQ